MANELVRAVIIRGRADLTQIQGQLGQVEQNFSGSFARIEQTSRQVNTGLLRIEGTSRAVTASLRPLTSQVASLVGVSGGLGPALSNIVTLGLNPLTLAVGGTVLALGALGRAWSESTKRSEEFRRSMEDYGRELHDLNTEYLLLTKQIDEAEAATRRLHRSQQAMALEQRRQEVARLRALVEDPVRQRHAGLRRAAGVEGMGLEALLARCERELAEEEANFEAKVSATVRNIRARQQDRQIIPKQERDDVEQFLSRLRNELDNLERRKVEISIGPEAALDLRLTQELEKLKEKLGGKMITPEQLAQIEEFSEKIRGADREVRQLNDALKGLEHLDFEDMERGSKAMADMERQAGKTAEQLRRQAEELQRSMGMELLPPRAFLGRNLLV